MLSGWQILPQRRGMQHDGDKLKEVSQMLTVTKKAAALLKAAKAAEGAADDAGIRIRRGEMPNESGISVGFAISDDPDPNDEEFEQEGLRIFVEDALAEPLDGRTLDVREADEGLEFIFR
jgi:Fe-S cluster assembly iron-binding protein IscA